MKAVSHKKENSKIEEFSKEIADRLVEHNTPPQAFFDETVLVNQTISDTVKIRDSILEKVEERKDGGE